MFPVLLLGLAALPSTGAQASCALLPEPDPVSVNVPTLSVQVEPGKARYRSGETMVIRVSVHVAAPSGPAVDRAEAKVDLSRNGKVVKNLKTHFGITKADGVATIRLRLPRGLPPGRLDAYAFAHRQVVPSYDCRAGLVYLSGEVRATPFVSVG